MPDALPGPEPKAGAAQPPEPAPAPALASKANDLEALRAAVVDAASVSGGLWLSYLFVLYYLLVAAGGVTHRDLFFASPVKLPFLNVDLPLEGFFWLGPALFLIVHAYVLLHFVMLTNKVRAFDTQLRVQVADRSVRTELRRQLPSNIFVQFLAGPREVRDGIMGFLLWLIALISLVIGPVALLVFFQLQFLPYHHEWITWWQRSAVVLDLLLLGALWRRMGLRGAGAEEDRGRRRGVFVMLQRVLTALALPVLAALSVPLVFAIATFPGERLEAGFQRLAPAPPPGASSQQQEQGERPIRQRVRETLQPAIQGAWSVRQRAREALVAGPVDTANREPESLWSNRLVLPGLDVIDRVKLDSEAKIAALPETVSMRARHLEGAVLIGAVLRKVDFTAARLDSARLDRADLRGAKLGCAGPLNEGGPSVTTLSARGDCANLKGAWLNSSQLQGMSLDYAQLQGALLVGARLQGASLVGAKLQVAQLDRAQLQGASLDYAQLQGASLDYAQLQGASLVGARLQGASFVGTELQGASLVGARLQGASLRGTFVWRVDALSTVPKGMRADSLVVGRKRNCTGSRQTDCDWTVDDLNGLKRLIEETTPMGNSRTLALARVWRLNSSMPLGNEARMAERWTELQRSSPKQDAHEVELADQLRHAGCREDGAPYVLASLARSIERRFAPNSPHLPRLAADFLKPDCAGAKGLPENVEATFQRLRDLAPKTKGASNASVPKP